MDASLLLSCALVALTLLALALAGRATFLGVVAAAKGLAVSLWWPKQALRAAARVCSGSAACRLAKAREADARIAADGRQHRRLVESSSTTITVHGSDRAHIKAQGPRCLSLQSQMDLAVVVEMARFVAVAAALHVQSMLHAMAASLVVVVLYLQSWTALAVVDAVHMLSALPAGPAFVPKQTAQLPKPKVQLPEVLIEATLTLVDCVRSRPDGKQAQPSPRVLSNVSSYNGSHVGTGKSLQLITCDHRPAKRQHFEGRWQRQGNGWVLAG